MNNVVNLAAYRSIKGAPARPQEITGGQARVIEFEKADTMPFRSLETRMLKRAIAALERALKRNDAEAVAEWLDEIEVIALHTDHFDIRERCRLALKAA